jgi:hypothetical protein
MVCCKIGAMWHVGGAAGVICLPFARLALHLNDVLQGDAAAATRGE